MPEDRIIRYWYRNESLSRAAVAHLLNYLSAFAGCRFVEDRESPAIWGDPGSAPPGTVRMILAGDKGSGQAQGVVETERNGSLYLAPDPLERILEKIAIKTTLGPHSAKPIEPAGSPEESLGGIIWSFVDGLKRSGIIPRSSEEASLWPDGRRFALAVTHDVDIIRRSIRGSVRLLFRRDVPGKFRGLLDSAISGAGLSKNPYDKIGDWIDREMELGLKSTFFIFPGNRRNRIDPKYGPARLLKSIEYLGQNGFELGVHSGIECYKGGNIKESRRILEEISELPLPGIRPHYLSASFPEYWREAAASGFEYSSCLGFDGQIGFYGGIDLPFIPFDIDNDRALEIVEIPIGIMDCGLITGDFEDADEVLSRGFIFIERVRAAGGLLVLDWHQRTLYNPDYPGWAAIFFNLLEYARNAGAYLITLGEAAGLLSSKMAGNS